MKKKNIISDFSALKEKVIFSENPSTDKFSNNKISPKVTVAVAGTPKLSDRWLNVGQSVVLMDSNLRGKIVELGKAVKIELEDGLIIESAYGVYIVTQNSPTKIIEKGAIELRFLDLR